MAFEKSPFGSIDEAARRQFEQFWAEGHPHPIEEFLPDETQQSYLPTLEELVLIDLEFSWRTWSSRQVETAKMEGETVVSPPQTEKYVARFPALRKPEVVQRLVLEEISLRNRFGPPPEPDEYRERFPGVELPDTVFSGSVQSAEDTADGRVVRTEDHFEQETLPRRFGPYELTERIGAGGMGVVYRAWQGGVEREIAVKVLRTDRLAGLPADHRQVLIDRFRNEARATARIDHPQIVSVYDVGEVEGVPYYTMQYVTGTSLGDASRTGPLREREAARVIQTVARAVQAAHDHGILHRDLKPHNIIVEEATGTPFVADFGLAKLLEENVSQTVTGEILGTPQYMSPEQATDSGSVTTRADVYALGATLYFLLTGQPPFSGQNHMEILRQVLDKSSVPPRQLNPNIDGDLEVICLKCLEKEPEQRYASARALADDLSSWLNGDAIAARPPGRWERVRRWSRKNPLPSSLAAVALFSVVFGVAALSAGLARATTERDNAEASDRRARATINDFFTIVSEDVLLDQPAMQPLRRQLLEQALEHYRSFVELRGDDPALQQEIAATKYRIGRITELLESPAAALEYYDEARRSQESLLEDAPPGATDLELDLSSTLNAIGTVQARTGRPDLALETLEEAHRLRSRLAAPNGGNLEFQRLLANTVMNIGAVHAAAGDFARGRKGFLESIGIRSDLIEPATAANHRLRRDQAMAWFNLANLEMDLLADPATPLDHIPVVESYAGEAIRLLDQVRTESPRDHEVRQKLARALGILAELQVKQELVAESEESFSDGEQIARDLAIENPDVPRYRLELATLLLMHGAAEGHLGLLEQAEACYEECEAIFEEIVEQQDHESITAEDYYNWLQCLSDLSDVREARGKFDEAVATLRAMLNVLDSMSTSNVGPEPENVRDVVEKRIVELSARARQSD